MRKLRKVMALLLTLAMVMGMSLTTFAAPNDAWTISISGTGIDSAIVKYGKIIEEDRTSTLGWKFVDSYEETFVNAWNNATDDADMTADQIIATMIDSGWIETPTNNNVKKGTIHTDARFTAGLAAVTNAATEFLDITNGTSVQGTGDNQGKGLYIIVAQRTGYTYLPMAAYMDKEGTPVQVVAKGAEDQLMKTIAKTGESVAPGDTVTYTIKQQYPYYAPNATDKTFSITDTLTRGTLQTGTVKVYRTETSEEVPDENNVLDTNKYSISTSNTGFTITISDKQYDPTFAGDTIQIVYDVTVGNNVTSAAPLVNQAFSSNGTGTIVETKPVSFEVEKVDEANKETKLAGAEFTIYKDVAQGTENAVELKVGSVTKYGLAVGTITTGVDGTAIKNNLDAQGKYYVKETKAPEGYSLNDTVYPLAGASVTPNAASKETIDSVTYTKITYSYTDFSDQEVTDTTLKSLPSTGGIGTTIFTIGGCVIMIAAAGLFIASRRKHGEN